MQKKTLAKEKHTSRSRSTPDRFAATPTFSPSRSSSAHAPANSLSLRQCGLVRSALPPVPSPLSESSAVCAAACGGWFFDISNLNVCKCIKLCHSEERSDEESLMISPGFKRFFAALRMTGFYIVRFGVRAQDPFLRMEHKIYCLMSDI